MYIACLNLNKHVLKISKLTSTYIVFPCIDLVVALSTILDTSVREHLIGEGPRRATTWGARVPVPFPAALSPQVTLLLLGGQMDVTKKQGACFQPEH